MEFINYINMAVTLSKSYGLFTKWGNITVCAWTTDRTYAFFSVWGTESRKNKHLTSHIPPLTSSDWHKQNKAQLILGPFSGESTDLQLACEACKQLIRLIRTALSLSLCFPNQWFSPSDVIQNRFHTARTSDPPIPSLPLSMLLNKYNHMVTNKEN